MPKGLGDSPLKRERQARRRTSASAVNVQETVSAPSAPATVESSLNTSASAEAPAGRSYNDVFFQRRPETDTGQATAQPLETASLPVEVSASASASAPDPVAVAAPVEIIAQPEPAPEVHVTASIPQLQEAPSAEPQQTTSPELPQPKSGFFDRIFGRLRKN